MKIQMEALYLVDSLNIMSLIVEEGPKTSNLWESLNGHLSILSTKCPIPGVVRESIKLMIKVAEARTNNFDTAIFPLMDACIGKKYLLLLVF